MVVELIDAHLEELQVWAVRSRVPLGQGLRAWGGFLLGLTIRAFTLGRYGGCYSHVLFRRGDTIWEATSGGVRSGQATEYDERHLIVDVYHVNSHEGDTGLIVAWLAEQEGRGYDYTQLLGIALDIIGKFEWLQPILNSDKRLICSELVALAYHQVGLNLPAICDVALWQFTPDHIRILHQRQPQRCEFRGRLAFQRSTQ